MEAERNEPEFLKEQLTFFAQFFLGKYANHAALAVSKRIQLSYVHHRPSQQIFASVIIPNATTAFQKSNN